MFINSLPDYILFNIHKYFTPGYKHFIGHNYIPRLHFVQSLQIISWIVVCSAFINTIRLIDSYLVCVKFNV